MGVGADQIRWHEIDLPFLYTAAFQKVALLILFGVAPMPSR